MSRVPAFFGHHLAVFVQFVRIVGLRVGVGELPSLRFGQCLQFRCHFARQASGLAQNHVPDVVGNHAPAFFAFLHLDDVHQGQVFHILAERSHEAGVSHLGPDVGHFVEQLDEQFVLRQFGLPVFGLPFVERLQVGLQVGHERTHHAARQSRGDKQGVVDAVERIAVESEEVVHHFLYLRAYLHVGRHIDFFHLEACVFQHGLHGQDVGVSRTPCQRGYGRIHVVASVLAYFEDGSHVETRSRMGMVLHNDVFLVSLDARTDFTEGFGAADARHVLQADFVASQIDKLPGHVHVVVHRVDGRVGDTKAALRNHAGFLGVADAGCDVADVIQPAKRTGDVRALRFLDFIKQAAHVGWYGTHAQAVQCTVEHVSLDACFVERFRPLAHGVVRVFPEKEVYLFKTASVGFHTVETSHSDNGGSHFHQLVHARHVFSGALPHVAEHQAEFYFSFFHCMFFF